MLHEIGNLACNGLRPTYIFSSLQTKRTARTLCIGLSGFSDAGPRLY